MNAYFTDSMARDHALSLEATAAASRRARSARLAARDARRSERALRRDRTAHPRAVAVSHAASKPFTAMRHWLVAGEL